MQCFEFSWDVLCRNWAFDRTASLADLLIQWDVCGAVGVIGDSAEYVLSTGLLDVVLDTKGPF